MFTIKYNGEPFSHQLPTIGIKTRQRQTQYYTIASSSLTVAFLMAVSISS